MAVLNKICRSEFEFLPNSTAFVACLFLLDFLVRSLFFYSFPLGVGGMQVSVALSCSNNRIRNEEHGVNRRQNALSILYSERERERDEHWSRKLVVAESFFDTAELWSLSK